MRILHLCRQYWPSVGGVERFVSELAARSRARGHTVEIVTLDKLWGQAGRLPASEVVGGIRVNRVPFLGGALFFVAPAIFQLVQPFDVLHVHNTDFFLDFLAATQRRHRKPLVVSTHGGFFHTRAHSAIKRLYFSLVTSRSLHRAQVVAPNSRADERRFGPYASRVMRVDNAIDFERFSGLARQPVPGRLLTVGRLSPNKNVGALLETLAVARTRHAGMSLSVLGHGSQDAALQLQARHLSVDPAVRWLGSVDDETLLRELAEADLFVSAATYEGFGLALLESMAAGLAAVVNDIEPFRDVVVHSQNGFLANYTDPQSAARCWLEVLALPAERRVALSAQARETARRHDWSVAIPKFEEIYRLALDAAVSVE